jgi:hypothetical protein
MTYKFAYIELTTVPYEDGGTYVTAIRIDNQIYSIPIDAYADKFPNAKIKLADIAKFAEEAVDTNLKHIADTVSNLILQLKLQDLTGIICTYADLQSLIEFFDDFDLGRLAEVGLEDYILSSALRTRLTK